MGKALIIKGANFEGSGIEGVEVDLSNKLVLAYDKSLFDVDLAKQVIGNPISGMIISNEYTANYGIQKLTIANKTAIYKVKVTHNFAGIDNDPEGIYCVALITDTDNKLLGKVQCLERDSSDRTEEHIIEASRYSNIGYIYLCGLKSYGYKAMLSTSK